MCSKENPVSLSQNGTKIMNDEYQQTVTKNLICSEGDQNSSTCQIWGHSSLVLSRKCPEKANLASFTKSKYCQKEKKSTHDDQNLVSSKGGQDTSACYISGHYKWLQ